MTKKLYIKTYGCQMNVYDSARMADVMAPLGYEKTDLLDDADLVVINTCHIREKATEKLYSELGRIRELKEEKGTLIAVSGCVSQAEGDEIIHRAPYVDIVLGPQTYHRLPEMVTRAVRDGGGVVELDFDVQPKFDQLPDDSSQGVSAFLTVQEGCDKFCTFCVVPYTRGAEFSRPVSAIYREALRMVAKGTREITLLGQNVNAFHGEGPDGKVWNLARLIRQLAEIEGLERIRYTTSHPRDMDDDLIRAHGEVEKLMPYLHLPVQSGSDRILAAMNRKHKAADYLPIIDRLREVRPDIALSSDFIVGFPGETDRDHKDTLKLVEAVGYAQAYSFKYSVRPGTPAATMESQVPEAVKDARLQELQALLMKQQEAFNRGTMGQTFPVLFDREGKHKGQVMGKSPYLQSVHVMGAEHLKGQTALVTVKEAFQASLRGELVAMAQAA